MAPDKAVSPWLDLSRRWYNEPRSLYPRLYGYLVIDITGNRWLGHQGGGKVCLHVIDTKRPAGVREVDAYLLRFLGLETDNSFIADSCRRIHGLCRNPFTLLLEFDIERAYSLS